MRRLIALAVLCALAPAGHADPLPNPDPEIYGADPPPAPPPPVRSRVPDYIAASVTSVLTAATVVSFYKAVTSTNQLLYDEPIHKYRHTDANGWKIATFVFGGAAIISGVTTAMLWARHRAPAFDVNANGSGAVVTFSGRF